MATTTGKTALIIGASRGLGFALAAEFLARGWRVTATVRGAGRTRLHELAGSSAGGLVVETVDITVLMRSRRCATGWRRQLSTCCSSTPA